MDKDKYRDMMLEEVFPAIIYHYQVATRGMG
jgi:hypothetical protein